MENDEQLADIAVIGLAVMGQNLILNMADHGYKVIAFNRTISKIDEFLSDAAKDTTVTGAKSIEELISKLKRPRRILLMVKAGDPVDNFIEQILPHLDPGDIIIDGGNSLFTDTARRVKLVETEGFLYVGTGISGGEDGARHGPSIMPGGSESAWIHIKDIFQSIAAKLDDGSPCCEWVGCGGAGHYVKMVHNGIEYGDMQLIAEAYQLLSNSCGLSADEMAQVFNDWNKGELDSYLIEITSKILAYRDSDGQPLIDKILDTAGQKGTGKWTVQNAAELGQPVSLITEAVFARSLSAFKDQRIIASDILIGPKEVITKNKVDFIDMIRQALYASKIISYTQGYMLMKAASEEYDWGLNYAAIAQMWSGGCIIRSRFLGDIKNAYIKQPKLDNLLFDEFFSNALNQIQSAWREVVSTAVKIGISLPAMSSALAFYDGYRSKHLPSNLIQAQRDFFGAHTYERLDKPGGEVFHTNWTGHGGDTSSGSYNA